MKRILAVMVIFVATLANAKQLDWTQTTCSELRSTISNNESIQYRSTWYYNLKVLAEADADQYCQDVEGPFHFAGLATKVKTVDRKDLFKPKCRVSDLAFTCDYMPGN